MPRDDLIWSEQEAHSERPADRRRAETDDTQIKITVVDLTDAGTVQVNESAWLQAARNIEIIILSSI